MAQIHQLIPFREMIRETPAIKERTWVHWLYSNRHGFADRCIVRVGRKVFVNRLALETWLKTLRN